ncbi:expressed unknown protein [Seminavis robusta]|uniref:Uncharacterized protein n=1 Tax=Seminavis robusta TaxID=568900 RepID=A0A9N8EKU2_9STRA|nr:expressed unknown protein [Seminavis robusta]|eukprot:Sro1249_g256000.1 n/a (182) ;mRNA; r:15315-15860
MSLDPQQLQQIISFAMDNWTTATYISNELRPRYPMEATGTIGTSIDHSTRSTANGGHDPPICCKRQQRNATQNLLLIQVLEQSQGETAMMMDIQEPSNPIIEARNTPSYSNFAETLMDVMSSNQQHRQTLGEQLYAVKEEVTRPPGPASEVLEEIQREEVLQEILNLIGRPAAQVRQASIY